MRLKTGTRVIVQGMVLVVMSVAVLTAVAVLTGVQQWQGRPVVAELNAPGAAQDPAELAAAGQLARGAVLKAAAPVSFRHFFSRPLSPMASPCSPLA